MLYPSRNELRRSPLFEELRVTEDEGIVDLDSLEDPDNASPIEKVLCVTRRDEVTDIHSKTFLPLSMCVAGTRPALQT